MPELRKDPVVGRWVIISTERSRRPTSFVPVTHEKTVHFCPFCAGNEDRTPPEIYALRPGGGPPNGPGWTVRVVPNKFPALQVEGTLDRRGEELDGGRRYFELKERCVFCDIVQQEIGENDGRRVVNMSERFLVIEPFAPRFPFETWILPRQHDASFPVLTDIEELRDLAIILKD